MKISAIGSMPGMRAIDVRPRWTYAKL